jgi:hypothetical protein
MSANLQPAFANAGTFNFDNLHAGDAVQVVTESIVLASGNLARGALLGRVTATGNWILSLSAASDGSQVPRAILAEPTDASGGARTTVAFLAGEFNSAAMTFGAGHTAANTRDALRGLGIFLKTNLPA